MIIQDVSAQLAKIREDKDQLKLSKQCKAILLDNDAELGSKEVE